MDKDGTLLPPRTPVRPYHELLLARTFATASLDVVLVLVTVPGALAYGVAMVRRTRRALRGDLNDGG